MSNCSPAKSVGPPSNDSPPSSSAQENPPGGVSSPTKRSAPIQVSLRPDPKSDVVTVRSITGGAGSPLVKSDGEASPEAESDAVEVGNTGESPEPNADTPELSPAESGDPARAQQKLTDDLDILSKLAHDVERISTEVTRIGSARCPAARGDRPRERHVKVDSARRPRLVAGMSSNVYYLQRKLTEADARVSAQDSTISNLRHDNALLRSELERMRTELREEKRRSGDLRRKLIAANKNLDSTTARLKQVSAGVSKIGALVKYSAAHETPLAERKLPVIPELPVAAALGSSKVYGAQPKGGHRQLTPRVRTSGGEIPFRPSYGTLRKAVDIYSRK